MKFALLTLRDGRTLMGRVLAQTAEALVITPEWTRQCEDNDSRTVKLADVVKIQTLIPQKA